MKVAALTLWELRFLAKYQLLAISVFISAMYFGLFVGFGIDNNAMVVLAVFSDPVMMGFMFTGVLILYDKNQRTIKAISVMPLPIHSHLLSRGLALTILAELCSMAIAVAAKGLDFNIPLFLVAVAMNSLVFYYIGIICLAGVDTFNNFIMRVAIMLAPLFLPLLSLIDIMHTPWFYLFPTMASVISFSAAFEPVVYTELAYAYSFLTLTLFFTKYLAEKTYMRILLCS